MKKNILIALFIITAFTSYAQIDTTNAIDMSQNTSKCNCEIMQFGDKIKEFRIKNGLQKSTMIAFISTVATYTESRTVEFTEKEYDLIEANEFLPFYETQLAILEYIEKYNANQN